MAAALTRACKTSTRCHWGWSLNWSRLASCSMDLMLQVVDSFAKDCFLGHDPLLPDPEIRWRFCLSDEHYVSTLLAASPLPVSLWSAQCSVRHLFVRASWLVQQRTCHVHKMCRLQGDTLQLNLRRLYEGLNHDQLILPATLQAIKHCLAMSKLVS